MAFIQCILNWVTLPTALFSLALILPPLYLYKLFSSFFNTLFSESLSNKVVLITGASSGIGEHLAYQYARKGACVALVARRADRLKEVAQRARDLGSPDVVVITADVAKPDHCKRFIDETISHFGPLDHLVNNAGIGSISMFETIPDPDTYRPVMDVNFWGAIYPTFYAIPHLKEKRGRVILNASAAGWLPYPRMSFYNASKAAIINFYETLRVEFGSDINITIVTPGWIESEMTQGKHLSQDGKLIFDEDIRDVQIGVTPVSCASDCAKAILQGACRGQRYVTEPHWYMLLYWYRVFCPEVLEWFLRLFYVARVGASERTTLSKKLLDAARAKKLIYPSSLQEGQHKEE